MSGCPLQASGTIELYFYDELPSPEAEAARLHLRDCGECRQALEELSLIESALATRPVVAAPKDGDWSAFMARLEDAIARERRAPASVHPFLPRPHRRTRAAYLAMAALLALVTVGVAYLARTRTVAPPSGTIAATPPGSQVAQPRDATAVAQPQDASAAMTALSEQHFERSKLVVLGLATKNPSDVSPADWAYERQMASSLLDDTRMYRRAAEQRGMVSIAHVMSDLELVLLQASTADEPDTAALERLQRLIRKRDLVTKMDAVNTAGM